MNPSGVSDVSLLELKASYRRDFNKKGDLVMQTVQELQSAVSQLSADELVRFREWFGEFDAEVWDRQFEKDAESGRLDQFADQAIVDLRAGKCKEL